MAKKSTSAAKPRRLASKPKAATTKKRAARAKPAAQTRKTPARAITRSKPSRHIPLHILSDSTGNLPQHMLTAFLTQFPPDAFVMRRHNFLQTLDALNAALAQVVAEPGIVFHAMVTPGFKSLIAERCDAAKLPHCDLTGEFVQFLSRVSGHKPSPNVHALHDTTHAYHNRIKALEFTLQHDDGLGLETIHQADIVLAGVSRTSKTPTSIYLAQQGYRVANVSLAMEVDPPRQLLALKRRVVGLLIDVRQLVEIRTNRSVGWHMGETRYNDPEHVERELQWSRRLFARHGWPALDVTDQAVEETAARIVNLISAQPA